MAKSWLNWFTRDSKGDWDRRAKTEADGETPCSLDIEPTTGLIDWALLVSTLELEREQAPGALLVVDLDGRSSGVRAKEYSAASEIPPLLVESIRRTVRSRDLIAHMTEYRFAVLLRDAPQQMADEVAHRIHESVEDTVFLTGTGILSIGVAVGGVVYTSSTPRQYDLVGAAINNLGSAIHLNSFIHIQ